MLDRQMRLTGAVFTVPSVERAFRKKRLTALELRHSCEHGGAVLPFRNWTETRKEKAMKWKDVTSHSRDQEDRTPRSWECRAGALKIIVTRHIHFPPDVWTLSAEPYFGMPHELRCKNIEAAKTEAIDLVRKALEISLQALR